jgi:capsular polysaccharide biosynthesis protein
VLLAKIEKTSLAYQLNPFRQADIVVAQHGAALGNLVWARESIGVVEIVPKPLAQR